MSVLVKVGENVGLALYSRTGLPQHPLVARCGLQGDDMRAFTLSL